VTLRLKPHPDSPPTPPAPDAETAPTHSAAIDWLYSKIPVRFPNIKICLSEGGIGWVAGLLDRLDHVSRYQRIFGTWEGIAMTPREVMQRNFWFCTIDDLAGLEQRHHIGVDHLLLESDYPHQDGTWPDTQAIVWSQIGKFPKEEIERRMEQPMGCRPSKQLGRARRLDDAAGRYIEFCKSTFPSSLDLRGLKIVVDCAHGAAYHIAPHVFHELGADVVTIGVNPDGFNINDMFGATAPQSLQLAVSQHKADLGIALDGDADRLLMVGSDGRLFDGDQLLYVIARHRHRRSKLKGVVGTLMSNLALEQMLGALGIAFARAKVGDRYVLEMLKDKGWELGGENSGHILCLDKHTTGDGIVSALQVLTAVRESGKTLETLAGDLKLFPQKLINVKVQKGFDWQKSAAITKAKRSVEKKLGDKGRVLLRPSGTEPVLRVMVEGENEARVLEAADEIAAAVEIASTQN